MGRCLALDIDVDQIEIPADALKVIFYSQRYCPVSLGAAKAGWLLSGYMIEGFITRRTQGGGVPLSIKCLAAPNGVNANYLADVAKRVKLSGQHRRNCMTKSVICSRSFTPGKPT